jgi:3-oxoacyl-[acyl-carrier-protein] synthase-1
MPAEAALNIVGIGAQAPLGLEPRAIAAAVRAGLSRFEECEWLRRKKDGAPTLVSLLETLDPRWDARARMRHLGIAAAAQALAPLGEGGAALGGAPLPVVIAVPPHRPGAPPSAGAELAREILTALPVPADRALSGVFDTGSEGALAALAFAAELFRQRRAEACLVGGVDSQRDAALLDWLAGLGRLKGDEAPAGLVPGEGAAFLLVCTPAFRRRAKLAPLGALTPPVCALEPRPWYMGEPCVAEGLTEALQGALSEGLVPGERAGVTWCDLNGEAWRADEWTYAYLRTSDRHGEPLRLRHPADCLGDLGSATGAMLVALAALDLAHPRSDATAALVFTASDTRPNRSACIVRRPQ